jgi:hypothetical protein
MRKFFGFGKKKEEKKVITEEVK